MSDEGGEDRAGLARWGRLVYRVRWLILVLAALSTLAVVPVIWLGAPLDPPDIPSETESARALRRIGQELRRNPALVHADLQQPDAARRPTRPFERRWSARSPRWRATRGWRVSAPPFTGLPGAVSRDGRVALAVVELHGRASGFTSLEFTGIDPAVYPALRGLVRSDTLEILAAGPHRAQSRLHRAGAT